MTRKFAALKDAGNDAWMDFAMNDKPKCPHCGNDFDIEENEAWQLYDENGDHRVTCDFCDQEFDVQVNVSRSFSTDEQEEDDE